MIINSKEWNYNQILLGNYLLNKDFFGEAITLCLELHLLVHESSVGSTGKLTYLDSLWKDLNDKTFRFVVKKTNRSIAWNIWHITRIEDLTVNILINNSGQVFNDNWMKKMNILITDTGNAMNYEETCNFSDKINLKELKNYRKTVGKNTRKTIQKLEYDDLKKKFSKDQLSRIFDEKGVLNVDGSKWLPDFWGRKNVSGILQMPVTRHQISHINDSLRIMGKICHQIYHL